MKIGQPFTRWLNDCSWRYWDPMALCVPKTSSKAPCPLRARTGSSETSHCISFWSAMPKPYRGAGPAEYHRAAGRRALDRIVSSAPDSVQPIRRSIPRRARCRGGVHPGIRSPAAEGDESRCDWRRICPDASACPALLSTARLYGDRLPQQSFGPHRRPWLRAPIMLVTGGWGARLSDN